MGFLKESKRINLDNCIFVKTILMFLVVLYHCCNFWGGSWFTVQTVVIKCKALAVFSSWLNSFHIYTFTAVSGYLFYHLKNEAGKYSRFTPFLKNKINRLLVPYCFAMLCWVAPITAQLFSYSWLDIFKKYILCINPSQLWFLWMLFDVFVIVYPLNKMLKNDIFAICVSFVSWGIGFIGARLLPNVFCVWTAFDYLPFFILGMKLREKDWAFFDRVPSWLFIASDIALFGLLQYLSDCSGFVAKLASFGLTYVVHMVGTLMAFYVLQRLAAKIDWKNSKVFMFLSKRSKPIYLFHQQVIYFAIIWLNGKVNPYINAAANFVIAMAVSIVISTLLIKFKVTRFLIGEK